MIQPTMQTPGAPQASTDAGLARGTVHELTRRGFLGASLGLCASAALVGCGGGGAAVARPGNNTGTGFFVNGKTLYDANGNPFTIRGVNKAHYDVDQYSLLAKARANTVRWALWDPDNLLAAHLDMASRLAAIGIVAVPMNYEGTGFGRGGEVSGQPAKDLPAIVDRWCSAPWVSGWKQHERTAIINIANEWGASSGTEWRDGYAVAVQRMRAAGYKHTLMIDTADWGQNPSTITQYGADILQADPDRNVIFSLHAYHDLGQDDYAALDSGLCLCVGEFGPGRNIGPSPTMQTPEGLVAACEQRSRGWLAWAFDDNNLPDSSSDDNWFAFFYQNYTWNSDADLTLFGRTMIPLLQSLSQKASIFG